MSAHGRTAVRSDCVPADVVEAAPFVEVATLLDELIAEFFGQLLL
jgi:hypothetical protein